jgi:PAS domain S-box-containing protein
MDAETWRFIDCNPAAVTSYGFGLKEEVIGKRPVDVSTPTQYDGSSSTDLAAYHIAQAAERGSTVFEWRHLRPNGEIWDAEVHLLSFENDGRRLMKFSLVDITERKFAALLQRLQHELILELNSCSDFEHGLDVVVGSMLKLDGIECGGIYVVDPTDQTLRLVAHRGLSPQFIDMVAHPSSGSLSVAIALRGEIRYGTYAEIRPGQDPLRQCEGLRGFAVIPITSKGTLIALMNLSSRTCDSIPMRTRTALETIALQIGNTLLRLRSEAVLRETEAIFQQFLDKSPVYVYFKDQDLRAVRLSSNFADMLGRPAKEILGKRSPELFPPELAASIDAADRAVLTGGVTVTVDEELNGRYYTTIKFPIEVPGKPRQLVGFTIDITDRKRAEQALRERTAQFQAFMDNVPAMTIIKDEDLRPVFFNKAMIETFPAEDWLGKTPHEIFPAEVADAMVADDRKAMQESPVVYEERWLDKQGRARVLETRKFVIRRGGEPPHLGAIISDITERKQGEALVQNAQKLDALGVLAGGIAHDFNNLLGGIFGYLDLARMEQSEEARQECIEHAAAVMERARDLTRQLLTFAKGGAPVKKVERLSPFLQNTVQFALSGSSIRAQITMAEDLLPCDYDKNQMAQVIDNIVINAVQAMPGGGVIEVTARNVSFLEKPHVVLPAGLYVCISIIDHGIGIPRDYLPRIFDPFFTTKQKGHGLGLATCYSIVTRHGGTIEVDSEPGQGSTFRVLLPAASQVAEATPLPSRKQHRGHGTFVVMDDEEVLLAMLGTVLRSFGYEAVCLKDGREVLDFCAEAQKGGRPIVGMIFDLTVPGGMGGKETILELRKQWASVPVFVASGYADDPVMARPQDFGFTGSIAKPFTSQDLSDLLNAKLGPA